MFDFFLLSIVGLSSLFGAYKGLIRVILGLAFLVATISSTYFFLPIAIQISSKYIENEIFSKISAFIGSYVFFAIIYGILSRKTSEITRQISGGFLDRSLGLIFGFGRGCLIAGILFIMSTIITTSSYIDAKNIEQIVSAKSEKLPIWIKSSYAYSNLEMTKKISKAIPVKFLSMDVPFHNHVGKDIEENTNGGGIGRDTNKKIKNDILDAIGLIGDKKKDSGLNKDNDNASSINNDIEEQLIEILGKGEKK